MSTWGYKMIKVIIVDDEILVRLGIKTYLENYSSEISVEYSFFSAKEALAFMEEKLIDIIITDIEMPDMNGIDYIKAIKAQRYPCGIIVLSCHDNFEYARETLSLGADKYMLKHEVCEDVLVKEIRKLYEKIEKNNLFTDIDKQKWLPNTKEDAFIKINDESNWYSIGVIQLFELYDEFYQKISYEIDDTMLYRLIEELISNNNIGTVFMPRHRTMFILFNFPKQLSQKEIIAKLQEVYYSLDQNIANYVNRHITMGLSKLFEHIKDCNINYNQAKEMAEYQFYEDEANIFTNSLHTCTESINIELELDVTGFLEDTWLELTKKLIKDFIIQCHNNSINPNEVKSKLDKKIHIFMYKVLDFYGIDEKDIEDNSYTSLISYIEIAQYQNANIMILWLISKLQLFQNYVREVLDNQNDFTSVLKYMDEQFNQPLVLSDVAHRIYMSTNYFCQVFKAKTGTTFINYLNNKRIEKVKQYLQQRQYSLEQIAEMVGYNNVNYMSRVFKKLTGKTISEYKILIK